MLLLIFSQSWTFFFMLLKLFFRWLFSCDFVTWCNFPTVPNIRGLQTNLLAAVLKAITTDQIVRRRPRDPPTPPTPRPPAHLPLLLLLAIRKPKRKTNGRRGPAESLEVSGTAWSNDGSALRSLPTIPGIFQKPWSKGARERRATEAGGTRTDRRKDFTEGEVLDGRELGEGGGRCRDEDRKSETLQFFFPPPKKDPFSGSVLHFCSDFLFQWVTLHLMGFSLLQDLCVCPSYTPPNAFQYILKSKWQWKEKNRVGGACRHFRHVHDRGTTAAEIFLLLRYARRACARRVPVFCEHLG